MISYTIYPFLAFLLLFSTLSNAQEIKVGDNYWFELASIPRDEIDTHLLKHISNIPSIDFSAFPFLKVKVVESSSDSVRFVITTDRAEIFDRIYNPEVWQEIDTILRSTITCAKSRFEEVSSPKYDFFRGVVVGSYTIPVKIWPSSNLEYEENFELGLSAATRFKLCKRGDKYVDIGANLGLNANINLTSSNSLVGDTLGGFSDQSTASGKALSTSLSAVFHVAKNVNIGFFYGWDKLTSNDRQYGWFFNGKPWLAFGINVGIVGKGDNHSAE